MTKEKLIDALYFAWIETLEISPEEQENHDKIISYLEQNNVDKEVIFKIDTMINAQHIIGLKEGFEAGFEISKLLTK